MGTADRARVLVTEDEPRMAQLVEQALVEDGYDVDVVGSGERAIDAVSATQYDLVLLDVMLPGLDGFATCRRMRERGASMAIVMLTARDEVDDRVSGLDAGADDYLSKPFSLAELLARVRAHLRRGVADYGTRVAFGDLVLDTAELDAVRDGVRVRLTPRESAILEALMRARGKVVPRHVVFDRAWPAGADHQSNVLDVMIRRLRRKIDVPFGVDTIETVRGVGYRLCGS
jgi:two-component system, OmpR family, response regulator